MATKSQTTTCFFGHLFGDETRLKKGSSEPSCDRKDCMSPPEASPIHFTAFPDFSWWVTFLKIVSKLLSLPIWRNQLSHNSDFPTFPDFSWHLLTLPDFSQHFSRHFPTFLNIFQTYPDLSGHFLTYPKISRLNSDATGLWEDISDASGGGTLL